MPPLVRPPHKIVFEKGDVADEPKHSCFLQPLRQRHEVGPVALTDVHHTRGRDGVVGGAVLHVITWHHSQVIGTVAHASICATGVSCREHYGVVWVSGWVAKQQRIPSRLKQFRGYRCRDSCKASISAAETAMNVPVAIPKTAP